jgi:excisionase family DNA binding protein
MDNVILSSINLKDLESVIYQQVKRVLIEVSASQPDNSKDEILPIDEAAKFLSIAVPTLYGYVYKHNIPYMKRRGRLYFSKSELLEWLKSSRRMTNQEIKQAAADSLNR